MPRASGAPISPAAAAAGKDVRNNAGHYESSCSANANQQTFRPVTRSMTRLPAAIAALSDAKKGESASTGSRSRSASDACFSVQAAASRPTVTHVRTPQSGTSSVWKPLTQPIVLSEELKRASIPTTIPTAKRSRVAPSQSAKVPTSNPTLKANPTVPCGKNNRNEECMSQDHPLDGAVILSPAKKLETAKSSCDAVSKRKDTIRIKGHKLAAPLPMAKLQTESEKTCANVLAEMSSSNKKDDRQSVESAAPLIAQQVKLETENNSSENVQVNQFVDPVITEAIANRTSQVNQSVAPVITEAIANRTSQVNQLFAPDITEAIANRTNQLNQLVAPAISEATANRANKPIQLVAPVSKLPRKSLHANNHKKIADVLRAIDQATTGATSGPSVAPKLQIGNVKDASNVLLNPAYRKALVIKHQEQLLKQFKLQNSQQQPHIRGPALFSDDDVPPPIEPLGTRCQLCKLDLAFRTKGEPGHAAATPPVVVVLACHHTFHSSCIEAVYGLAEPSQCIACLEVCDS